MNLRSKLFPFLLGLKDKTLFLVQNMSVSTTSSSVTKQTMPECGVDRLNAVEDLHGGIRVDMEEPMDPEIFSALLRTSISQWRQQVRVSCISLHVKLAATSPIIYIKF